MAFMEISPDKEGPPHSHPFDQCGIVVEGGMELSLGEEKRLLGPMETYFIPAGRLHRWRTFSSPAKIVDVVPRQD
jgi:quercetin dioxygenase-like cupin family protein